MNRIVHTLSLLLIVILISCSQNRHNDKTRDVYLNSKYSVDKRVEDIISRMTLKEKVSQILLLSDSISHLGITQYNWINEGLHGIAGTGVATVFPQAIGLAASFDVDLVNRVSEAISTEARAKYNYYKNEDTNINFGLSFRGPIMNLYRDPRWGKGQETFGEDPYLASQIGLAYIKGMNGDVNNYLKILPMPHHYTVSNKNEPLTSKFFVQELYETCLPMSQLFINEGEMNAFISESYLKEKDDRMGSSRIVKKIIKDEFGFKGINISDAFSFKEDLLQKSILTPGIAAIILQSGTDIDNNVISKHIIAAVEDGIIKESEIDEILRKILLIRFKLGMFDSFENDYSDITYDRVASRNHKSVSLEAARKSIVLLKNKNSFLPVNSDNISSVAVIGPNGDNIHSVYGTCHGYSKKPMTIYEGVKQFFGARAKINYLPGSGIINEIPNMEPIPQDILFQDKRGLKKGLIAQYFNNNSFKGKPLVEEFDKNINEIWANKSPKDTLGSKDFSVIWNGYIIPKKSGKYALGSLGNGYYKVFFQDTLFLEFDNSNKSQKQFHWVNLIRRKAYKIRVEFSSNSYYNFIQLLWGINDQKKLRDNAVKLAKESDLVIMSLGLSPEIEGNDPVININDFKNGNRENISLPNNQLELLKSVYKVNKNIVLVLSNGGALAINWSEKNIPAIIETWYGGQEIGIAVADVIFGNYNPGGRLPITFYKGINDLPDFKISHIKGRTYRYYDNKPLYPFGYGLSYTNFKYSNIRLERSEIYRGESSKLLCEITNIGKFKGDEVVQMYISMQDSARVFLNPIKELKGFERVTLNPNETKTMSFELTPNMFSFYDAENSKFIELSGVYNIMLGSNSRDVNIIPLIVKED